MFYGRKGNEVMSKYEVRGVKEHKGHEGEPVVQCSLYRDGVKVCEYSGDDHGGSSRWFWVDKDSRATVKGISFGGKATEYEGTVEEALLADFCAMLPERDDVELKMKYHVVPSIFVEDLVVEALMAKKLARACKTKTCFRLVGDEAGSYRTLNVAWSDRAKEWLEKNYGAKVEKIFNAA